MVTFYIIDFVPQLKNIHFLAYGAGAAGSSPPAPLAAKKGAAGMRLCVCSLHTYAQRRKIYSIYSKRRDVRISPFPYPHQVILSFALFAVLFLLVGGKFGASLLPGASHDAGSAELAGELDERRGEPPASVYASPPRFISKSSPVRRPVSVRAVAGGEVRRSDYIARGVDFGLVCYRRLR